MPELKKVLTIYGALRKSHEEKMELYQYGGDFVIIFFRDGKEEYRAVFEMKRREYSEKILGNFKKIKKYVKEDL
jgi:hypothetical protein